MMNGSQEHSQGTERAISRRRFLTVAAGSGAFAVSQRPWDARSATSEDHQAAGHRDTNPAQWVMVIDLARCDGCEMCTKACRKTHFTGDQAWIKVLEVEDGHGGVFYRPQPCMHCENAPCLNVCPVGATFRDEHGTILIDHDRCVGCRFCMAACPYGARSFNWEEPENPAWVELSRYTPEFPVPRRKGTVDKCMFCAHEANAGKLPACLEACRMQAIWFGDLTKDIVTNGSETVRLSWLLSERNGYRLKEELGTRPRVWYLPGQGQEAVRRR